MQNQINFRQFLLGRSCDLECNSTPAATLKHNFTKIGFDTRT